MKAISQKKIFIGWLVLAVLLLIAMSLGKSISSFGTIALVWLVLTIISIFQPGNCCRARGRPGNS